MPLSGTTRSYLEHKASAQELAKVKIAQWNAHYGVPVRRVAVRNQKSRWGSCSKLGNISLNYRMIFLPEHLADYLVVHELCHLRHMNHSARFWRAVGETIPNWRQARRELRAYARFTS
jgi:predicted metal-dependent hydrolase